MLVIGVGNEYRSDDGVGLVVVRALKTRKLKNVHLLECNGDCVQLLEAWQAAEKVILIDAVASTSQPGRIYRIDLHVQEEIPAACTFISSHAFSIAETIVLARMLGWLPPALVLYGIEGERFMPGNDLSPAVEAAVQRVVTLVASEIQRQVGGL